MSRCGETSIEDQVIALARAIRDAARDITALVDQGSGYSMSESQLSIATQAAAVDGIAARIVERVRSDR
jgi:hypothetical protein